MAKFMSKFASVTLLSLLVSACGTKVVSYDTKSVPLVGEAKKEYVLSGDFLFDFNKSNLSEMGKQTLSKIADELKANNVKSATVIGYTDRLGSDAYNLRLSQARANAAKQYLISQNVGANITAVGRGKADQIEACEGVTGQALKDCLKPNRRVVISTK